MGNWCWNQIEIRGDEKELEKLVELVKSEESDFDFNKIVPFPFDYEGLDAKTYKEYERKVSVWIHENWGTYSLPDPESLGFSEIKDNYCHFTFDTSGAPSTPATVALSKKFPTLKFTHSYESDGSDLMYYDEIQNGEIVKSYSETSPWVLAREEEDEEDGDW